MAAKRAITVLAGALVLAVVVGAAPTEERSPWDDFKDSFKRVYKDIQDELVHRTAFEDTVKAVEEFNSKLAMQLGFRMALNKFADWTEEELKSLCGARPPKDFNMTMMAGSPHAGNAGNVPDSFDWRDVPNVVGPVKNQGRCGSCWAYGVTGTMEAFQNGLGISEQIQPLSDQNLVDCSPSTLGCGGGWPSAAFDDLMKKGGVMTEEDYPYEGVDGQCRFDLNRALMTVKGYRILPQGDEQEMKRTIAQEGPIAVGIKANYRPFQLFEGGSVFDDPSCPTDIDHIMLAVGYGTDPQAGDYWILKNSWGADWADSGYMRIARGKGRCALGSWSIIPEF